MSCHNIQAQLHDYIDQALSETMQHTVEQHLETCEACQQELADIKTVLSLTMDLDDVEPPPFLASRISARTRSLNTEPPWFLKIFLTPVRIPAGALAALCLLFMATAAYTLYPFFEHAHPPPRITENTNPRKADKLPDNQSSYSSGHLSDPAGAAEQAGSEEQLADYSGERFDRLPMPDLQIQVQVVDRDANAKTILGKLLEMDADIFFVKVDNSMYRIVAGLDNKKKNDLLDYFKHAGQKVNITKCLSCPENMTVKIDLLEGFKKTK